MSEEVWNPERSVALCPKCNDWLERLGDAELPESEYFCFGCDWTFELKTKNKDAERARLIFSESDFKLSKRKFALIDLKNEVVLGVFENSLSALTFETKVPKKNLFLLGINGSVRL